MILDGQGRLVWFISVSPASAFNLEVETYEGRRVLTWWQGDVVDGHGSRGQDVIMDSSYRTVAVLHAGNGYSSDLHEFQLAPSGSALIDAYVPVRANLSSVGGPSTEPPWRRSLMNTPSCGGGARPAILIVTSVAKYALLSHGSR